MSAARWPVAPAAVALDLLDPAEQPVAARLAAQDPAFRAEVERLRATTAALGALGPESWALEAPPALGDVGLAPVTAHDGAAEDGADGAPAAAGAAPVRPRAARRHAVRRRVLAATGAAAAVAAAAVAAVVVLRDDDAIPPPPPTTLALRPLAGVAGRAQLTLNGAGTEAELRGAGLRPSGPHDYYEAWLADDRGRMVSMGTFRVDPDGKVDVHMEVAVDVSRYALVDVSLEPDDGNPAHSATSVLRARL